MKPAHRRARLFKKTRPDITQITAVNFDWMVNWHWAAYNEGQFGNSEEAEFKVYAKRYLTNFNSVFMLEDVHPSFSGGKGPVGYMGCMYDGWNLKPHAEWYPWAMKRNKLRCIVAFLSKMRRRKDVGIITIETGDPVWPKEMRKYIGIYKLGTIRKGRADGLDQNYFYMRGNSHGIHQQPVIGRHNGDHDPASPTGEPDLPASEDAERVAVSH